MQRSAAPPDKHAEAEADLLALADDSKQKFLNIVGRLQKESLKSDTAYVDESVEDHEETFASVSEEEDYREEYTSDDDQLILSYNPTLRPGKGCIAKFRKQWPTRPSSPPRVCSDLNFSCQVKQLTCLRLY